MLHKHLPGASGKGSGMSSFRNNLIQQASDLIKGLISGFYFLKLPCLALCNIWFLGHG